MSIGQRSSVRDLKVDTIDLAFFATSCITDDHKSGYLVKQGQINTFSHKRRFFVLHGNCLFYYKSEELSEVIGMMWLEGCKVEEAPEVLEGLYGFTITTLGGREVKLMAETVEERSEWVAAIRDCGFDKTADNIRTLQNQVEELRAANSRAKSDLTQAESARDVLQREFDALLHAHDMLKEQYEALLEAKANKSSNSLVVANRGDLEERVRALEMDRDILLRCRGILPRTLPVWANEALSGNGSAARIWVGSWNMGANEPFAGMDRGRAPKLLRNFVPSGYDIYLLGVQEGVSEGPLEAIESLLGMEGCVRLRLDTHGSKATESIRQADRTGAAANGVESMDKLFGRGDGSLLSPKFTGIAVYVNERIINDVKVLGCTHRAFSPIHSKGGVAVALSIRGRTLAFVTCHLEAHKNEQRRAQYRELCQALGAQLGESEFHLAQQFHHVIWCGDLNYRCVGINGEHLSAEAACRMLEQGENRQLFEVHDQLNQERAAQQVFAGFHEPQPFPDFFPTYKKYENRRPLDYSDPSWVRQCYRIRYKEPFYKGGKVKERTPGYCDRILYHSLPDMLEHLVPESVTADLLATSLSEAALENRALLTPTLHNYRSVNDGEGMSISDHSPVFATFLLKLDGSSENAGAAAQPAVEETASTASSSHVAAAPGGEEQPAAHDDAQADAATATADSETTADAAAPARTLSGDVQFRLKNFRLVWGASASLPGTVKVVFPAPFEVDHGHRFVAVSADPPHGSVQEVADNANESHMAGVWHRVEGTTGSCVGVEITIPESMTDVPPLTLGWKGTVPLENLHVLVKASLPPNPRQEKKESTAGECSVGLRRLCKMADTHEPLNVCQPLEREGLPMFNVETRTNSKMEVSLSCDIEVVSPTEPRAVLQL